jgi:hypothetical protein
MTSLFKSIDYGSGDVTHIEEDITLEDPIGRQIDLLREDLLQVQYDRGRYVLDVGWYPSFEQDGEFCVTVAENYQWEAPLCQHRTRRIDELKGLIKEAVALVERKRQE